MTNRPADIVLPPGWNWERVEVERAMWKLVDNMVPIASAPGVIAWGTINSIRSERKQ